MMTTEAVSQIEEKLQELCAAIVADEEVRAAREQAEAFLADESAVTLYREVARASHEFEERHHSGERISDAEASRFASLRQRADDNPLIQRFMEAQGVLQEVANTVNGFVTKTLEKGRIPTHKEVFGQGGCGSGCGCHH